MTGYDRWEDRERHQAEENYLDSLIGRTLEPRGPGFTNLEPEMFLGDQMGPGPQCHSARGAPVEAYPYRSPWNTYRPLNGLSPDDIDAMLMRLLEGYRILDELFNPRRGSTNPGAKPGDSDREPSRTESE